MTIDTSVDPSTLLGKQVEIVLEREGKDPRIITKGKLLAWSTFGECMVETPSGEVVYCWPMLSIMEIK